MLRRVLQWYSDIPVTIIATSSLIRSLEAEGAITWGHEMLLVAVVPIALSGAQRGLLRRHDLN